MSKKVEIIRSGDWVNANIDELTETLNEAIAEWVEDGDQIINIQCKSEDNGTSRFWIYIIKK